MHDDHKILNVISIVEFSKLSNRKFETWAFCNVLFEDLCDVSKNDVFGHIPTSYRPHPLKDFRLKFGQKQICVLGNLGELYMAKY